MDHGNGERVNDRTHGQQFKARFLRISAPTSTEGIEKYLSSGSMFIGLTSPPSWRRRSQLCDEGGLRARNAGLLVRNPRGTHADYLAADAAVRGALWVCQPAGFVATA
jgi:hypothetical protein